MIKQGSDIEVGDLLVFGTGYVDIICKKNNETLIVKTYEFELVEKWKYKDQFICETPIRQVESYLKQEPHRCDFMIIKVKK